MAEILAPIHRWTRRQYEGMVLHDILEPQARVELLDGVIIDMSPQRSNHAATVCLVEEILRDVFHGSHTIRIQMPLTLDDSSQPEPDIAVAPGKTRDYTQAHPTTAVLIVEVADTTLVTDRDTKQALYARNGIPEYWIVNLRDNTLEVRRDPQGDRYRTLMVLRHGDTLSPQARPDRIIAVADLLP